MLKNVSILHRVLVFFFVFLVGFSLLPCVPASAAVTVSGIWKLQTELSFSPSLGTQYIQFDLYSESLDVEPVKATSIYFGDVDIEVNDGTVDIPLCIPDGRVNHQWYFDFGSSGVSVSDGFYTWLTQNASEYSPSNPPTPPPPSTNPTPLINFHIWAGDGSTLLETLTFSSLTTPLRVTVYYWGLLFEWNGLSTKWTPPSLNMGGLGTSANGDMIYNVGSTFTIPIPSASVGGVTNAQYYAYYYGMFPPNYDPDSFSPSSGAQVLPAVDFISWLVVAVGSFLSFEFVPGFSIDTLLLFCLLIGLLFFFLKISGR